MIQFAGADHPIVPDERDLAMAHELETAFNEVLSPRVGDFVKMPDGTLERFSHNWGGEALQSSPGGSWYLGKGYAEFSGGLNPPIPVERLLFCGEMKPGRFWFFHHGWAAAHSAVFVWMDCRVYQVREKGLEQYDPLPHPLEDANGNDIRRAQI